MTCGSIPYGGKWRTAEKEGGVAQGARDIKELHHVKLDLWFVLLCTARGTVFLHAMPQVEGK